MLNSSPSCRSCQWKLRATVLYVLIFFAAVQIPPGAKAAATAAGTTNAQAAPILSQAQGITNVQGLVIVPKAELVQIKGRTGVRGVLIEGPQFLRRKSFQHLLEKYLGAPITEPVLIQIQAVIRKYCEEHDHIIVDVLTREQDILEGTIQIAVIEAKVSEIKIEHSRQGFLSESEEKGRKWFSDSIISRGLRTKTNDVVLKSRIDTDLNWLNRNTYQSVGVFDGSFREVNVSFQRSKEIGGTDVTLEVHDRFPFRVFAGYDDSGLEVIGEDQIFAGFNWANVFGLDHRLSYQYITDTDFRKLSEHIISYVVPLPWRHEFTLFGAYADVNPDFSVLDPSLENLKNEGVFYQVSARYAVPLPRVQKLDHEVTLGFDFKHTDTPLLFESPNPGNVLRTNNIDVAQIILAYTGRILDPWGRTAFSIQGVYSPGDVTEHNKQPAFTDFASTNTHPDYAYARGELRRETYLPYGFSWYLKAGGQYCDSKLIATEVFGLGGYDTVRGYNERVVNGDAGWLVSNELRTPQWPLLSRWLHKAVTRDAIQFLVFFDYGSTIINKPTPSEHSDEVLLSVGAGLRYSLADYLHLRFDYGLQLDRDYVTPTIGSQPDHRAHIGVEASF